MREKIVIRGIRDDANCIAETLFPHAR